jgi:hypothetical protein
MLQDGASMMVCSLVLFVCSLCLFDHTNWQIPFLLLGELDIIVMHIRCGFYDCVIFLLFVGSFYFLIIPTSKYYSYF